MSPFASALIVALFFVFFDVAQLPLFFNEVVLQVHDIDEQLFLIFFAIAPLVRLFLTNTFSKLLLSLDKMLSYFRKSVSHSVDVMLLPCLLGSV